jgi:cytochrome oxidase Cu insertion factor (SCO1/SenC/PrrC family)
MPRASAVVAATALVGASAGLIAAMAGSDEPGRATAPVVRSERVAWVAGARPAPSFSLGDQDGRRLSPAGSRSRSAVVTFLSSRCVEQCPIVGRLLSQTWRELGRRERPVLIVVSVDPWSDTPASARAFVKRSGWPGEWHWLMAGQGRLSKVWEAYGVQVRRTRADPEHTALAYLLDRDGYERAAYLIPFDSHDLAADARALARE